MYSTEKLINSGFGVIGTSKSVINSVVVVGCARGGTSLVAGALQKLGLFMGEQAVSSVYEDTHLSAAIESKDFQLAKELINKYKSKHGCFGWKRPSSIEHLDKVNELFESPNYIFIFKDIFSIANRNAISMLMEIVPSMRQALKHYAFALDFIEQRQPSALLVSYEKAVSEPEKFVDALINFCVLSPSDQEITIATSFIRRNPDDYLDVSRITKARGRLDGFSNNAIYGWAQNIHSKNIALVEIYLNDQLLGTIAADKERPDLIEKIGSACAFWFVLPEGIALNLKDIIRARVVNEVRDLENSPLYL